MCSAPEEPMLNKQIPDKPNSGKPSSRKPLAGKRFNAIDKIHNCSARICGMKLFTRGYVEAQLSTIFLEVFTEIFPD